jgi:hypothetical protein
MPKSVDVLVAEAAHDLYAAGPWGEFYALVDNGVRAISDAHSSDVYKAMLEEVRYPALVEALCEIANQPAETRPGVPWVHWSEIARRALGGEVPSTEQGELEARIAELEVEREEMLLALRGFAFAELDDHGDHEFSESYADDLYERRFLHAESTPSGETWIHRTPSFDDFVIETLDRVLRRRLAAVDGETTTTKGSNEH